MAFMIEREIERETGTCLRVLSYVQLGYNRYFMQTDEEGKVRK